MLVEDLAEDCESIFDDATLSDAVVKIVVDPIRAPVPRIFTDRLLAASTETKTPTAASKAQTAEAVRDSKKRKVLDADAKANGKDAKEEGSATKQAKVSPGSSASSTSVAAAAAAAPADAASCASPLSVVDSPGANALRSQLRDYDDVKPLDADDDADDAPMKQAALPERKTIAAATAVASATAATQAALPPATVGAATSASKPATAAAAAVPSMTTASTEIRLRVSTAVLSMKSPVLRAAYRSKLMEGNKANEMEIVAHSENEARCLKSFFRFCYTPKAARDLQSQTPEALLDLFLICQCYDARSLMKYTSTLIGLCIEKLKDASVIPKLLQVLDAVLPEFPEPIDDARDRMVESCMQQLFAHFHYTAGGLKAQYAMVNRLSINTGLYLFNHDNYPGTHENAIAAVIVKWINDRYNDVLVPEANKSTALAKNAALKLAYMVACTRRPFVSPQFHVDAVTISIPKRFQPFASDAEIRSANHYMISLNCFHMYSSARQTHIAVSARAEAMDGEKKLDASCSARERYKYACLLRQFTPRKLFPMQPTADPTKSELGPNYHNPWTNLLLPPVPFQSTQTTEAVWESLYPLAVGYELRIRVSHVPWPQSARSLKLSLQFRRPWCYSKQRSMFLRGTFSLFQSNNTVITHAREFTITDDSVVPFLGLVQESSIVASSANNVSDLMVNLHMFDF